jgi:uncharacterized glyoxalase superfamily protein PhnB
MVVADPAATVEFLRTVFDATGDPVPDRPAEVQIGDSLIMISAVGEREAFPVFLYVYVDNADMRYQRALEAGAVSIEEPVDTPYGDRRAMIADAFGNMYQIANRLH